MFWFVFHFKAISVQRYATDKTGKGLSKGTELSYWGEM